MVNNSKKPLFENGRRLPRVKEIFLGKNVGFGAAANIGARSAKGEVLLFLNPDTILLASDALDQLNLCAGSEGAGIVGGRLLDGVYRVEAWGGGHSMSFRRLVQKQIGLSRKHFFAKKKGLVSVDWVSGAVFAVKRLHFLTLGGFDETFFLYFEDADLCLRFQRQGFPVQYHSLAKVLHRGGASFSEKRIQKKHYYGSQCLYFQKNRPKWESWIMNWIHQRIFREGDNL